MARTRVSMARTRVCAARTRVSTVRTRARAPWARAPTPWARGYTRWTRVRGSWTRARVGLPRVSLTSPGASITKVVDHRDHRERKSQSILLCGLCDLCGQPSFKPLLSDHGASGVPRAGAGAGEEVGVFAGLVLILGEDVRDGTIGASGGFHQDRDGAARAAAGDLGAI